MLVWFLLLSAYYATVDRIVRAVTVDLSYLVLYSGISDSSSEEFCECRQSLNGRLHLELSWHSIEVPRIVPFPCDHTS